MFSVPIPDDFDLQPVDTVPIKKPEAREQARLIAALRRCWNLLPDEHRPIVFHVPNGGSRNAMEAANLKTQGVLAGIPDLVITLRGGRVLWIEMKADDGRVSPAQKSVHAHLRELEHSVITAYSAEEALQALRLFFQWGCK